MSKVTIRIGAPRSLKTTQTLKDVAGEKLTYYVVRTNKNIDSTCATINKYLSKEYENTAITCNANKVVVCPKWNDKEDYLFQELTKCSECPWNRKLSTHQLSAATDPIKLTAPELKELSAAMGVCYKRILKARLDFFYQIGIPHFYCLTYAMLQRTALKKDCVLIFDEARYLEDMPIAYQEVIGCGKKHPFAIVMDWIMKMRTAYAIDKIQDPKIRTAVEQIMLKGEKPWNAHILRVAKRKNTNLMEKVEKEYHFPMNATEYEDYQLDELYKRFYREAIADDNKLCIPISDYWFRRLSIHKKFKVRTKILEYLKAEIKKGNVEFVKLYTLLTFISQLNRIQEDKSLELDIGISDDGTGFKTVTLYLVWRKRIAGKDLSVEDRSFFENMLKAAKKVYLIDATPFPIRFYSWWFGSNPNAVVESFDPQYKFTIVLEGVRRNLSQSHDHPEAEQELGKMIKTLSESGEFYIYARNKNEVEWLKSLGVDPSKISVSRGKDSEGVQIEGIDATIAVGLPWANLSADDWRKPDFHMLMQTHSTAEWEKLKEVKMFQVLLQQSFRGAKPGKDSGSIWLGADKSVPDKVKNLWGWAGNMKFVVMPKHADKFLAAGKQELMLTALKDDSFVLPDSAYSQIKDRVMDLVSASRKGLLWAEIKEKTQGKNEFKLQAVKSLVLNGALVMEDEKTEKGHLVHRFRLKTEEELFEEHIESSFQEDVIAAAESAISEEDFAEEALKNVYKEHDDLEDDPMENAEKP